MFGSECTLQFCLWRAADALLPQDGGVVDEGELELGLQVKVLPAAHGHGGVEHVGDKEGHAQGDVGLHQVQHLEVERQGQTGLDW